MGELAFAYDVISSNAVIASLALNDAAAVASKIDGARKRGFRITKMKYDVHIHSREGLEGPFIFGVAVGLSAAEVEACLEADPQSPDETTYELTKRAVFPLGVIERNGGTTDIAGDFPGQGAKPLMEETLNWSVREDEGLFWWFYNMGGAATAGTKVGIFAKYFGVWLRD